ncbi:DUF938 domain-containing protein [Lusitaniella coriacea LEGE 07157]|uniref:DUF938 domain-containing protein n=1 Tax=Lusitaniella coriacea LEGE 07157 TaxID=945747 RepID=A0A8J7E3C9_9CYAN|nr:DUF938 domain-containing protein [Lusitaniella coriacea]MBE9117974.1 DUF938 domain-containing protein [Lusitaniella coriacea LEGE 07157]
MNIPNDAKQHAPATQRNREPILEVLQRVLPPSGTVLEIASGTGEHAAFFAPRLKPRQWLPSDPNPERRVSIAAWQSEGKADNLYPPINLDARDRVWSIETDPNFQYANIRAIVNINMIHISPWSACLGLMAGAGRILQPDGILYLYGPYKRGGEHTAPSNEAFDASLRSQNPEWGVRDLDDVAAVAKEQKLSLLEIVQMPANNLSVIFQKG